MNLQKHLVRNLPAAARDVPLTIGDEVIMGRASVDDSAFDRHLEIGMTRIDTSWQAVRDLTSGALYAVDAPPDPEAPIVMHFIEGPMYHSALRLLLNVPNLLSIGSIPIRGAAPGMAAIGCKYSRVTPNRNRFLSTFFDDQVAYYDQVIRPQTAARITAALGRVIGPHLLLPTAGRDEQILVCSSSVADKPTLTRTVTRPQLATFTMSATIA